MPSASGYMGEKYFQKFGPNILICLQLVGTGVKNIFRNLVPDFLTCPQLVGTWVKNIFRNLVPDFWRVMLFLACHVLNVACHGVSISIVSIISVSCRVRILRVSMFMPCHGHPEYIKPTPTLKLGSGGEPSNKNENSPHCVVAIFLLPTVFTTVKLDV